MTTEKQSKLQQPRISRRSNLFALAARVMPLLTLLLLPMLAQADPAVDAKLAALEAATKSAQSAGDNAWMLTSAALVLMMTGPGLALFYGGLVRKKNVLGTMMQSFMMMAVITVLWALVGYSLAFGEGATPFLGDLRYLFLEGVGSAPNADYAATIPQQTFMV
jgi:Amt family ammonium transporter